MNWLDVIIGLVLAVSLIGALRNGLSGEFVRLLALVLGVAGGMWWYQELAVPLRPYIEDERLAEFAAFGAVFIGAIIAGAIIARVLAKLLGWSGLRWFDRLLGAVFGLVRGLAVAAVIVLAVVAFSPTSDSASVVAESRLAPWVLHGARAAAAIAPAKLEHEFSVGFDRVRDAWIEGIPTSAVRQ